MSCEFNEKLWVERDCWADFTIERLRPWLVQNSLNNSLTIPSFLTCNFPIQLWTPPTPPQDDNDIYIDSVMMLMYDTTPIPESKLPPIYVRKEHKRLKMDPSGKK